MQLSYLLSKLNLSSEIKNLLLSRKWRVLPGPPSRENRNKMPHAVDELPTLRASRESRKMGQYPRHSHVCSQPGFTPRVWEVPGCSGIWHLARNCPVLTNCLSPGQIMAVVRRGYFVLVYQPCNLPTMRLWWVYSNFCNLFLWLVLCWCSLFFSPGVGEQTQGLKRNLYATCSAVDLEGDRSGSTLSRGSWGFHLFAWIRFGLSFNPCNKIIEFLT